MNYLFICCLEMLIPSLIVTIYGLAVFLRKYRGLYFSMGVLALVCLLVGQFADSILVFTGYTEALEFHIGTLGAVGSCLFFLTANMGPMTMLSDSENPAYKKYSYLAFIGPVINGVLFLLCVVEMVHQQQFTGLNSTIILTALTMLPLYYSTRIALIPDVEGGFIECMRPYNYAVIALELLNTLERGMHNLWQGDIPLEIALSVILYGLIGVSTLVVMIFLKKGAEKWKTI